MVMTTKNGKKCIVDINIRFRQIYSLKGHQESLLSLAYDVQQTHKDFEAKIGDQLTLVTQTGETESI
jgi:hypothetical protein